jgi:methyl-accepting chemotaxis protein
MVEQLNSYVERQSAAVSQSSAAIEEMISNTRSVTDTLARNSKNVEQLKEVSDVGRAGLNGVAADIQEIAGESESLLEINSVMQNIASQTNLLSMNAAIEAAHAGDVGKGFAVVADEIRKLAESSSKQSKTIGAVLKQIKSSIDKITRSTSNVLEKFEAIDGGVKMVADQERMIYNAMEEQGRGSQQVLQGIAEVNEITHQVKDTSRQLLEDSKEK